jgi:subtilase family serine protease
MRRFTLSSGVRAARISRAHSIRPCLEILEDRLLPAGGFAVPGVVLIGPDAGTNPSALPAGYSPAQISQAYGFNPIRFANGTIQGNGSGQTIAIVDAYSQPNIAGDLQTFDSTYGLPAPPSFTVVNQNGGGTLPSSNQDWGLEESLDVEWAHAMAPGANIVLVEANSNNYNDLMTAVNYARNLPGVSVVSMSWGGSEWFGENGYDSYFTTAAGHQGVTFVASSGDNGAVEYPSTSPNVLTVGGTQLSLDGSGNYLGETAWSGSGGGISLYETQPSYQNGVVTQTSQYRAVPDVAYDASTSTPFAIYDTSMEGGWMEVGGTSAGAPQWAALVAIADQGRALDGKGTLDGGTQTLPTLYRLPQSDFHDVTSGGNGTYWAGPGYDLVTGRGSPIANLVVAGLVAQGSSASPPWVATPANVVSSTATTANLNVLGGDSGGASNLTYTWSVLSEPSGAAGPTFSVNGVNAAQNTTVTFHDAGAYTFQVIITNASGLSVASNVSFTVNPVLAGLTLTPSNPSVYNNGTVQFAAAAVDQFGHALAAQPAWNWSLAGIGSLSGSGLYTAPGGGNGSATVYVSGDGLTQAATVTFQPPPSSPITDPGQIWAIWLQFVDSWMAEMSQLQSLWQFLLTSWPAQ